jgi:hypothetical protein
MKYLEPKYWLGQLPTNMIEDAERDLLPLLPKDKHYPSLWAVVNRAYKAMPEDNQAKKGVWCVAREYIRSGQYGPGEQVESMTNHEWYARLPDLLQEFTDGFPYTFTCDRMSEALAPFLWKAKGFERQFWEHIMARAKAGEYNQ